MRLVQQRRGDYFRRDRAEGHAVGAVPESIMHARVVIGMGTEVRQAVLRLAEKSRPMAAGAPVGSSTYPRITRSTRPRMLGSSMKRV